MNVTSEFRIKEIVDEQGDVWLEDRDPNRAGMVVAVEKDGNYASDLQEKIDGLTKGEIIKATLQSQNPRHTIWHFAAIKEPRSGESTTVTVSS